DGKYVGGNPHTAAGLVGYDIYRQPVLPRTSLISTIIWEFNEGKKLQRRHTGSSLSARIYPLWTNFRIGSTLKFWGWSEQGDPPPVPVPYIQSRIGAIWGLITSTDGDIFPMADFLWKNPWGYPISPYQFSGPLNTGSDLLTPLRPHNSLSSADLTTNMDRDQGYALGLKIIYYQGSNPAESEPTAEATQLFTLGNIVGVLLVTINPEDKDENVGHLAPVAYVQGSGMVYPSWIGGPNWHASRKRPSVGDVIDDSSWITAAMIIEGPQGGTYDSAIFDEQSFIDAQCPSMQASYSITDENETPREAIEKMAQESLWSPVWLGQGKMRVKQFRHWGPVAVPLESTGTIYWEDIIDGKVQQDKTPDDYVVNRLIFKHNKNIATGDYEKETVLNNTVSQDEFGIRIA
ncbi:hypothetical protein LCGC14_2824790, partial [marine sediment metagenome]